MAQPARVSKAAPFNIAYESEHCTVRELEPADACETICGWMADPAIAKALNAPVRALSMDDLRKYIAQHDRVDGHLLGVFKRSTGELIGLWSVYVDWEQSEFLVNVLIPGKIDGEYGALNETGRPLYAIMFEDCGLETMRYNILASNHYMQDRMSIPNSPRTVVPEHISEARSASGDGRETIQHFRMNREQYLKARSQRAERDAAWLVARKARREAENPSST